MSDSTDESENPGDEMAGSIHVFRDVDGKYISEVDGLTNDESIGSATIDNLGIGAPDYIMLWVLDGTLAPTQGQLDALRDAMNGNSGGKYLVFDASNPNEIFTWLQTLYPGFNELIMLNTGFGAGNAINWDLSAGPPGMVVDQIAVSQVPEPAAIGLLAAPALMLSGRRRRRKRLHTGSVLQT